MKKIILCFLTICIFISIPFTVSADDKGAELNLSYEVADNGNIIVKGSIVDITIPEGICILDYTISYDESEVELLSATVNMPEEWEPFKGKEFGAEDLSVAVDGGYRWLIINSVPGYGVTQNDDLFIILEFKPVTDSATIIFDCGYLVSDDITAETAEYDIGKKSITVNAEQSNVSRPVNNSSAQEGSSPADETSNSSSGESSDITGVSDDDTSDELNDNASVDNTTDNGTSGANSEVDSNDLSDTLENNSSDDKNDDDLNLPMIISIIVVAVIIIALIAVIFMKGKKNEKIYKR